MENFSEIGDFFKDKSVLITGATGFIGKVLIEKLLRDCAGIKNIYILVRPKKGKQVEERLKQVFNRKLFDKIREKKGNDFEKVVAIEGDITELDLGISLKDVLTLIENVSVVVHSAATVNFNQPIKEAVEINLSGTLRLVELSKKLTKLEAFIYVSTAYSNCIRHDIEEKLYPSPAPPQKIIELCEWMDSHKLSAITPTLLGEYPNTYCFTKSLTESMIVEMCGDIPLAIIRPSIVTASLKEPFPGWIDNLNTATGVIAANAKGVLKHIFNGKAKAMDIVPVDTVVNMIIALSWFVAIRRPEEVLFFNCTSDPNNRFKFKQMDEWTNTHSIHNPSEEVFRYPHTAVHDYRLIHKLANILDHYIPAYLMDWLLYMLGRKPRLVKLYKLLDNSLERFEFFVNHDWHFSTNNAKMLQSQLIGQDKKIFDFDITNINWYNYWLDYCLGVRRYLFNEDDSTIEMAKNKLWHGYVLNVIASF